MTETIAALQCIGCGRLEAPQPCVGVCEDREVALVSAEDYYQLLAQYKKLGRQLAARQKLLRRLAGTHPKAGQWEASFRAFQLQADGLLSPKDVL